MAIGVVCKPTIYMSMLPRLFHLPVDPYKSCGHACQPFHLQLATVPQVSLGPVKSAVAASLLWGQGTQSDAEIGAGRPFLCQVATQVHCELQLRVSQQ